MNFSKRSVLIATTLLVSGLIFYLSNKFSDTDHFQNVVEFEELIRSSSSNIFFVETTGAAKNDSNVPGSLSTREACNIESAASKNPNSNIFVIFVGTTVLDESRQIQLLKSLKNVFLVRMDFVSFCENTPIEEWVKSGKLFNSYFLKHNISNLLRFLLLWKYGGTYLDNDVLSLVSVESIGRKNFIYAENTNLTSEKALNNAILSFNKGHRLAELVFEEFTKNYNGNVWGQNGPRMVSRAYLNNCKLPKNETVGDYFCENLDFHVCPAVKGYPILFDRIQDIFDANKTASVLDEVKNAHFIHCYSSITRNQVVTKNPSSAFNELVKNSCPKVYDACDNSFQIINL